MKRIQRRLLLDTSLIGLAITLFVTILGITSRALQPLDEWFYDRRARVCQFFTPPPTDKLIHLNIDDTSLQVLGKWPWPRAQFAELIDEINRAGAKAVFMDIIFDDPSNPSPRPERVGPNRFVEIDDDAILADALRRTGNSLVPVSLIPYHEPSALYARLLEMLKADLETSQETCQAKLLAENVLSGGGPLSPDLFLEARREAMNARIERETRSHSPSMEELQARLLPHADPDFKGSPLLRLLREEYDKVRAVEPLRRFMRPIPEGLPPLARYAGEHAPILQFSRSGAACGYVDYLQTGESGVVRAIPLFANYRDNLFPQTDLALACAVLGVDVRTVRAYPDKVVIPKPPGQDGDIVIPVRTLHSPELDRDIGMFMDIPVRGARDWQTIYDHPAHRKADLHVSISTLWEPHLIRERVARNTTNIDRALATILDKDPPIDSPEPPRVGFDPEKWAKYLATLPPPGDVAARQKFVDGVHQDLKDLGEIDVVARPDGGRVVTLLRDKEAQPTEPRDRVKREEFARALAAIETSFQEIRRFEAQLRSQRELLRKQIEGRAVMIGWIATAKTDFFPTAVQPTCPGVVIHGMTFSAIMTRNFWYHVPPWVTALVTLCIGILVTVANSLLRPSGALVVAVVAGVAYLLLNGLLLFDYKHVLVGVAGPMVALGSVWSTGTLASFLIESRERARITRRFSSYTDPKLVEFVIENPNAVFDGQVREMSVIFTDLAGFTSLSEQLRERSVTILSQYLSVMVPIIRKNDGFVNKFLGDGIMCFFNAPTDDLDHAVHAVKTALDMQRQMRVFADRLVEQGLPRLHMRCGVSTGTMVVGDSGPKDASDYTVLGDTVNFASRLESANKALGTNILMSHRTTELLGENRFLLRPVGKLQVVGKTEGVMTYEPLAPFDEASPADLVCAAMSTEMIAAYLNRDFTACIEFADQMDQQIGETKLASLYRKASAQLLKNPPGAEFKGNLILTEK